MAYEDERMSIFFRISRLETIVGDLQKEHDLSKCPNQPLKELVELRERNKDLKHKIEEKCKVADEQQKVIQYILQSTPEPCTKFKNASIKEWIAKLNEEVAEVLEAMYDIESVKNNGIIFPQKTNLLREMVDVSTVIRSMQYAYGFTDKEIADMQKWVNKHNRERGYMNRGADE